MSLSASNRFSLKDSRESFFVSGKSFYFSTFTVIYLSNLEPVPVFAVNISKKVAKMAHDRNKLRRQIQQLIQTNLSSFPPHKYLFLPKNSAINSYSELKASFTELLSKLT